MFGYANFYIARRAKHHKAISLSQILLCFYDDAGEFNYAILSHSFCSRLIDVCECVTRAGGTFLITSVRGSKIDCARSEKQK
jgi:hypothetical protein